MKYNFDGGKITITITRKDLSTIIENKNRWNGCKITNMDKLMKELAPKLIQPIFEDGEGDFSGIEKAIEDTAYELFISGADYLDEFKEANAQSA